VPIIETRGPIEAWIVDDTGFPKKGKHSVGVARQYCGQLGKQDNCQVAVSLSVASAEASLALGLQFAARRPVGNPRVAYRLYLPKEWAEDPARRAKAGVPEAIAFATKPMIALAQIEAALAADVPQGVVLADAGGACPRAGQGPDPVGRGYEVAGRPARAGAGVRRRRATAGQDLDRRQGALARQAVAGSRTAADQPAAGAGPPTRRRQGVGERSAARSLAGRDLARGDPGRARLALRRAAHAPGASGLLAQRALARALAAGRMARGRKYWLANLPAATPLERLVHLAKLRWRTLRDYLELKQELGLGHYEGRGWRGFHHHASLCIAAYGFLVGERLATFPSTAADTGSQGWPDLPPLPAGFVPRGSSRKTRASRRPLHRHLARSHRHPPRPAFAAMSMLLAAHGDRRSSPFMTQ
jgi:hypothetical protein